MKVSYLSLTAKHYASWTWDCDQINYVCEVLSDLPAYVMDGCVNGAETEERKPRPSRYSAWKAPGLPPARGIEGGVGRVQFGTRRSVPTLRHGVRHTQ